MLRLYRVNHTKSFPSEFGGSISSPLRVMMDRGSNSAPRMRLAARKRRGDRARQRGKFRGEISRQIRGAAKTQWISSATAVDIQRGSGGIDAVWLCHAGRNSSDQRSL